MPELVPWRHGETSLRTLPSLAPQLQPVPTVAPATPGAVLASVAVLERTQAPRPTLQPPVGSDQQVTVVFKFGGSSIRDAVRMREVADIIRSFPSQLPCVVLSAMGKSTNMLLECGDLALNTNAADIPNLTPLRAVLELHLGTCDELQVEPSVRQEVQALLHELQQLLIGISIMHELTPRAKDSLVSFGERLSTRIFASYLRTQGVPAWQYDAWDLGLTTTDEFCNADVVYEESLPRIRASLLGRSNPRELPIVTGFLGRGLHTGAITTLGRGGSDLTATVIGAALELDEVQVWKDVDGVLTSDPRLVPNAQPVGELTYEEAMELAQFGAQVLHPQAMQPAIRAKKMAVRVKNSYNRTAPGTVISSRRSMDNSLVTSIVLKSNATLVDVVSTRMLGQYGFLARVFEAFRAHKMLADLVVATSEVSVSLTLDPRKVPHLDEELDGLKQDLGRMAHVSHHSGLAIVSLICNVQRTGAILKQVFEELDAQSINVVMLSQGTSKTNISLVVDQVHGVKAVQVLHRKFFG